MTPGLSHESMRQINGARCVALLASRPYPCSPPAHILDPLNPAAWQCCAVAQAKLIAEEPTDLLVVTAGLPFKASHPVYPPLFWRNIGFVKIPRPMVHSCTSSVVLSSHLFWMSDLWTHQPRSHRISSPSFCGACLNFYRGKDLLLVN